MFANTMRCLFLAAAVVLLLVAASAVPAKADTVFSNFGPGMSFNTGAGSTIGTVPALAFDEAVAERFTSPGAFRFSDALVAAFFVTGSTPFSAFLETDSSGVPGVILDTLTLAGTIEPVPNVVTYNCGTCPLLTSGTSYWLVLSEADPSTQGAWNQNSIGDVSSGNHAFNGIGSPTGPWITPNGITRSVFEIDGVSAVPEPGTLLLLGSGFAGLVLWSKTRAKN